MCVKSRIINVVHLNDYRLFNENLEKIPDHGYWGIRKEKIRKYAFLSDKMLSLGASLLLLSIFKEYDKESDTIELNRYRKPFFVNNDFHFNLSHSGNYVVCSYGYEESGIDIESYQSGDLSVARSFFNKKEAEIVEKGGMDMFIRLWTLKESYIKEKGEGLNIPLDSFQIIPGALITENKTDMHFISVISNQSSVINDDKYNFVEFKIDNFHISVCSKGFIDNHIEIVDLF